MRAAAVLLSVAAHPQNLECGTDQTTRLKVGAQIMHQAVVAADADGPVQVHVSGETVTVTAQPGVFFAVKAFGAGATLTPASSEADLKLSADCTSQLFTSSAASASYSFSQAKATEIAVGYSTSSAPSPVHLVTAAVGEDAALRSPETVLNLDWTDCGDSDTHAKVTALSPKTLTLGQSTPLVGTGALDEDVTGGTWQITVKAGLISKHCSGDLQTKSDCDLPLKLGTITWDGLTLPLAKGPAIKVSTTVDMSAAIPGSLAKATIQVQATEDNGHKLLCLQVKTAPAEAALVV